MYGRPNSVGHCRLGLTVTRKVGGAVRRNRVKRRLRDVFRRNQKRLDVALDLVINGRAAVLERKAKQLERDFLQCFDQLTGRGRP